MSLRTTGIVSGFSGADFTRLKAQLTDYQRQLGTGQKAETYGGLGSERTLALGLQASRSDISAWKGSISLVTTRIKIMDTALTNTSKTVASVKTALTSANFTLANGSTTGQLTARGGLDSVLSMLNSSDGSRYLFSGRATSTEPVRDSATIMAGENGKDGFSTVLRERLQADLGSSSSSPELDTTATGRLTLSATGTQPVTLDEDGVHSFGLKISGVSGSVGGVTAALTAGPPASLSLTAGSGTANAGESQTINFTLPDGTTERITLTAVPADATLQTAGDFKVGATPAETLDNMRAALGDGLANLVQTKLAAASAVKAGEEYFKGETDPLVLGSVPAGVS
jgi:flagellar hook-associated protein 3 FlgL